MGLGGFSPASALELVLNEEQQTGHEPRRIIADGDWLDLTLRAPDAVLLHQAYYAGAWHTLCEFTLEHMPEMDREMANWYTSAHPKSHFREHLMAALATPEGRVTLQDGELTLRARGATAETRMLRTHSDLLAALAEHFGLRLPPDTRFECPGLAGLSWER